ncbi:MAG: UDP-N-acetylmuramate dehydrogenase [Planctomycetota bacterium]|jgi:UDP-N-acetylmuramate dehydrogenase
MSSRASDLRRQLRGYRGAIREQVSMAPHTHIRLGGPAEFFMEPATEEDVALVVKVTHELEVPVHILGGGSNLIVADDGVEGVVLSLHKLNHLVRDENRITAGAGLTLPSLIRSTKDVGLKGLELLVGIPAQVGGAVAMNAGTKEAETFDHLISLTLVNPRGDIEVWGREKMAPKYRDGGLRGRIVLHATWELEEDDPEEIFSRLEASLKRRNATQPVADKSVGCVFTNPEGDSAGRLIEEAGCKLMTKGAIRVSGRHANFFVNEGGGTCADFLALVAEVQERVLDKFGVHLQPEIRVWGI